VRDTPGRAGFDERFAPLLANQPVATVIEARDSGSSQNPRQEHE
jgi:hypothetical protein